MPLGIVSDEDFESEKLDSDIESHPINPVSITPMNIPGRNEGDNNVPSALQKIIGETAITDGRQSAIEFAREFGISSSSVSAYSNGATSTESYNRPNKDLKKHLERVKNRISKKSVKLLERTIDTITDDKLAETDAKDLSGIARNLASTIEKLEGRSKESEGGSARVQVNIMVPPTRDLSQYETIEVNNASR